MSTWAAANVLSGERAEASHFMVMTNMSLWTEQFPAPARLELFQNITFIYNTLNIHNGSQSATMSKHQITSSQKAPERKNHQEDTAPERSQQTENAEKILKLELWVQ